MAQAGESRLWVTSGKPQNEHKFSGLPRKADLRSGLWLGRLASIVGHPVRGSGYLNSQVIHGLVDCPAHGEVTAAASGGKAA